MNLVSHLSFSYFKLGINTEYRRVPFHSTPIAQHHDISNRTALSMSFFIFAMGFFSEEVFHFAKTTFSLKGALGTKYRKNSLSNEKKGFPR